jgi:hypothetical protein
MVDDIGAPRRQTIAGLRRFLDLEQQRNWMRGETFLRDAEERSESLELRLKYVARFESSGYSQALRKRLHPDPAPDGAALLVGFLPAVDTRQGAHSRQCKLDGALLALC